MVALAGTGGTLLVGCADGTGLGLSLVSAEQVEELGLESWERIRAETPASNNRSYRQRAERISNRILGAAGENPNAWETVVFRGDEANAFALPGNKIGVYEGMFRFAQNDDQLAAVIGHEVGHNQAEHARERLSTAAATQAGLQLVSAALQVGNIGYANEIAGLLGAGAQYGVILPYGRNQELEADRIGLGNMAQAGYDPRAAIELWQNMRQAGGGPPTFLSTHPAPDDRIAQLQELMPEALEIYQRSG
ncbi:MAG TPA: M48 family metallopeptidase [Geminicoccaceae bacterium]|nr:M48 family metallopeptidase [Geminicoccaceae bacterium]